jgi:RecJ-like exonuclease
MQIPAMAGFADKTNNPAVMEKYLEYAKEKGYTKEILKDIASVIDFVSAKLRFMEAREYIEVLFGEPMKKQKALVNLLAPYIQNLSNKGLEIAKNASESKKVGDTTLQMMNIETSYPKFFYPKTGKVVGLLHDYKQEVEKVDNLVTIGIMNEAITIRATDKADFSVPELIRFLTKKIPLAFVEGGGHKNAGSISFLPNKQKEVLDFFIEYMKQD